MFSYVITSFYFLFFWEYYLDAAMEEVIRGEMNQFLARRNMKGARCFSCFLLIRKSSILLQEALEVPDLENSCWDTLFEGSWTRLNDISQSNGTRASFCSIFFGS